MPYHSVTDLPDSVRHNLPLHAQRIYMNVYNSSVGYYDNPSRIAWGVVKKHYVKSASGRWVKRDSEEFSSTTDDETDYD
ncbi:hypothetical protein SlGVgp084 [Spodoptera litura granulovirus]|uniref:ChaB n=1 Tax=Spodoptera litura granulovirus TaxID=359919 RepID=A5IZT6_9BBAC|nr:hypothetical protein SlGVgp084 [Spodoptera litura granulovirus]ABQ52027.1 hypothetical protein SlGVgp084 [Spodoptera litura granulovirus]